MQVPCGVDTEMQAKGSVWESGEISRGDVPQAGKGTGKQGIGRAFMP